MSEESAVLQQVAQNVAKVMVGKKEVTEYLLAALAAGGHVLLEDMPGSGKTVLARSLAASMNMDFHRIQFTPDLLPSDVTGLYYYNQKQEAFLFRQGPAFTHLLLRSTGPLPEPSRRFWSVWRSARSPWKARPKNCPFPIW